MPERLEPYGRGYDIRHVFRFQIAIYPCIHLSFALQAYDGQTIMMMPIGRHTLSMTYAVIKYRLLQTSMLKSLITLIPLSIISLSFSETGHVHDPG